MDEHEKKRILTRQVMMIAPGQTRTLDSEEVKLVIQAFFADSASPLKLREAVLHRVHEIFPAGSTLTHTGETLKLQAPGDAAGAHWAEIPLKDFVRH